MIVLALYTCFSKYITNGPTYPQDDDTSCTENWWTNLLYVNNIVKGDKMVSRAVKENTVISNTR